jgi:hypothetical protein
MKAVFMLASYLVTTDRQELPPVDLVLEVDSQVGWILKG